MLARSRRSLRRPVAAALVSGALLATWTAAPLPATAQASSAVTASPPAVASALDPALLRTTLDGVHDAGMYGILSSVRDGAERWAGASGVADVRTGRPVTPGMQHRIGSVSKAFTSVALMQQVQRGRLDLDAPIGRYLPALVPGERGRTVTTRMLLNHTSGIGEYFIAAFPSFLEGSTASLDDNRFTTFRPEQLVRLGLAQPPTGAPGELWSYSNTNYVIAGLLLEKLTGTGAEDYITREVIDRAGLRHTYFPRTPFITGPHAKMYEAMYGLIDPPRDYSVYNMSWAYTAGAIVSTMDDLNAFYRALLGGRLVGAAQLAEMQRTVPVTDGQGNLLMHYGLGIYAQDLPCGRFWGHDGSVLGAGTVTLSSPDARRQSSIAINLMKYQSLDENGKVQPHAIDFAMGRHLLAALCGAPADALKGAPAVTLFPTANLTPALR
ncbi:serine hydrolase domain-containing protein [Sphaerisporangium melleum]|uniref:serine hydrolase domain-containing protein n=1 Tax=Sphaerisporangium melleum TaxID=321316 RepID=UPI001E391C2B|nr:serine hydrolase domain-containing protein [Sphaerisporangium melleum]